MRYTDKGPVFLFTNENVREYITNSGQFANKNVLTVAASGDQAFESVLAGARHVDTFDINSLQKVVMDVKTAMIKNMNYNTFMNFFFSKHSRFNTMLLAPIANKLSAQTISIFINMLYNELHYDYESKNNIENISYLHSSDKYKDLQVRLPENFNFKHIDILKQSDTITQMYDIMILSNILSDHTPKTDYETVLKPLSKQLSTNDGMIFFNYSWIFPDVSQKEIAQHKKTLHQSWNWMLQPNQYVEIKHLKATTPNQRSAFLKILHQNNPTLLKQTAECIRTTFLRTR